MATDILIKRSTTTGAVPTTSDLSTGELAINTVDKRLFTNNSGTIVEIGTAPTSLAVTNNATVGGTLGVTGNTSLSTISTSGAATLASGSVTGNFSVAGTLTVSVPSNSTDAASKGYVDTAVANVIDSAPGALDTLNELAAAINDDANFATTITNALAGKLALAGGTMTGDITLGANKITSTATPATDDTLTRKGYVDSILGSATSAADSATAAASSATDAANSASAASTSASNASTSETNAASSASAASTSATNAASSATAAASSATSASNSATASANSATAAATSATNAENAYDSFDDRYLGAKASDPSVDNDGDALITGALYFNTGNNTMRVYNGSAWEDVVDAVINLADDTTPQLGGNLDTNGNDITFGDNDKAIFGAGSDLQIYHDSSDSYISDQGTGNLRLRATNLIMGNAAGTATYARGINGGTFDLYYNNSPKLATTATGIDVTGTVTADGADVSGGADSTGQIVLSQGNTSAKVSRIIGTDQTGTNERGIDFNTYNYADYKRMNIAPNGNISFYEHTGTTPKLYWDASGERLGIGTSSPNAVLSIERSGGASAGFSDGTTQFGLIGSESFITGLGSSDTFLVSAANGNSLKLRANTGETITFDIQSSEAMRIDSSGNVGIGTNSPSYKTHIVTASSGAGTASGDKDDLVVENSTHAGITTLAGNAYESGIFFGHTSDVRAGEIYTKQSDALMTVGSRMTGGQLRFLSGDGAEAMRIDSSGNLLVGHTTAFTTGVNGATIGNAGSSVFARDGGSTAATMTIVKRTNDGVILNFNKDGSTVGSIGANGGRIQIDSGANSAGVHFAGGALLPTYNQALDSADQIDLGNSTYRWQDLYLSGGVYLGGTGSANYLDDYEEGSWTPTYAGSTTAGTISSYTTRWGRYVKIGNLVHLSFEIGNFAFSGGSGSIKITGIPFSHTTADSQGRVFGGGLSLYQHSMSAAGILNLSFRLQSNDDLQIIGTIDNATWEVLNVESPASGLYVAGNITYYSA